MLVRFILETASHSLLRLAPEEETKLMRTILTCIAATVVERPDRLAELVDSSRIRPTSADISDTCMFSEEMIADLGQDLDRLRDQTKLSGESVISAHSRTSRPELQRSELHEPVQPPAIVVAIPSIIGNSRASGSPAEGWTSGDMETSTTTSRVPMVAM